jgi:hypothetical protein
VRTTPATSPAQPPADNSRAEPARARRDPDARRRIAVLAAGIALVALAAAWTAVQITAVVLDETVYKYAAASYADGLGTLFSDPTSRGVARLYSLLITPAFALFDGDVAVRVARSLNGVLFAATALPVAALARRAGATPWGAVAAGLLSVAVPWLTLATILFSESLAYLLFACTVLAMLRLLEAPSLGREALVLALLAALVATRVQFVVAAAAWVLFLAVREWRASRRPWRRYPLTTALTVLALLVVAIRARKLAGPYFSIGERTEAPGDFGLAALWEVEMLAIGVGVVPALLAGAWFAGVLGGRVPDRRARDLAQLALVLVGALAAGTLFAQGGWLDLNSEERYFIYAVPFLWIGAVAALRWRALPAAWLAWGGLALAAVMSLVPNPVPQRGEQFFLGPVSGVLRHGTPLAVDRFNDVTGLTGYLSGKDLIALGALALAAFAFLAWRRGARRLALVPAVVVQLGLAVYAFAGIHGHLESFGSAVGGEPFARLGWIDRSGAGPVTLADNATGDRDETLRATNFWNDDIDRVLGLTSLRRDIPPYPVNTLGAPQAAVDDELFLAEPPPRRLVAQETSSPLWQLDGREVARGGRRGGLAIVDTGGRPRMRYLVQGVSPDGQIPGERPAPFRVLGGHRVEFDVAEPLPSTSTRLEIHVGRVRPVFDSSERQQATLAFDLCDRSGVVEGSVVPARAIQLGDGRTSVGRLTAVRVTPCR